MPDALTDAYEPEQAVLASVVMDGRRITEASEILTPADFLLPLHRTIFAAMQRLHREEKPIDYVLLCDALEGERDVPAYLAGLTSLPVLPLNIRHYAELVLEASRKRALEDVAGHLQRATDDTDGTARAAQEMLDAIVRRKWQADAGDDTAEALNAAYAHWIAPEEEDTTRIYSGITALDSLTGGMGRGELHTVAAPSGLGKTSLLCTVAQHVAARTPFRVAFFSVEMRREEIFGKLVSLGSSVPYNTVTRHEMTPEQADRARDALDALIGSGLAVVEAAGWTAEDIVQKARVLHDESPLGLILVDYIQEIVADRRAQNREIGVGEIAAWMKNMAAMLDVPVMAATQLNREGEVRESDKIKHVSHSLLVLAEAEDQTPGSAVERVVATLKKNRTGAKGTFLLAFEGPCMRFTDPVRGQSQSQSSRAGIRMLRTQPQEEEFGL